MPHYINGVNAKSGDIVQFERLDGKVVDGLVVKVTSDGPDCNLEVVELPPERTVGIARLAIKAEDGYLTGHPSYRNPEQREADRKAAEEAERARLQAIADEEASIAAAEAEKAKQAADIAEKQAKAAAAAADVAAARAKAAGK